MRNNKTLQEQYDFDFMGPDRLGKGSAAASLYQAFGKLNELNVNSVIFLYLHASH